MVDLELKLAELRINGYVLFENLIPIEKVDRIREAFLPLLETVKARHDPVESGDIRTGRGRLQHANRYTVEVPWEPPFSDPAIYENPALLAFLDQYWGSDDYHITCYSSNNPYPGSTYQHWHLDAGITRALPNVSLQTCPHFGIKFPLVDTFEENGSFEILPCTQYIANPVLESQFDEILENGDFPSKQRLNMERGTLWIQDPRAIHRGTPNHSDHPRPELVICYSRPWFAVNRHIEMTQAEFDKLSERGKGLLRRCRIVD
ncbi:MAG: phytanoyl-CoA dioxygenase family protein [Chloroflexota bacterium]